MSKVLIFFIYIIMLKALSTAPMEREDIPINKGKPNANHLEPHRSVVEVRNGTYHGIGPREEARAMCSVRTEEINATANATITRKLHGVVTSRELHSSIQRLELIIFGQMQQLWQSLDALKTQLATGTKTPFPDRRTIALGFN